MLPAFAKPIAEARANGKRPAEMVIVSDGDHGLHRRFTNPVVRIETTERPSQFDWTFLAGLNVEVATNGDYRRTMAFVAPILRVLPDYLRVWWLDADMLIRVKWLGIVRIQPENGFVCPGAERTSEIMNATDCG